MVVARDLKLTRAASVGSAVEARLMLAISLCAAGACSALLLLLGAPLPLAVGPMALFGVIAVVKRPFWGLAALTFVAPFGELLSVASIGPLNLQHVLGTLVPLAVLVSRPQLPRTSLNLPVSLLLVSLLVSVLRTLVVGGATSHVLVQGFSALGHFLLFFSVLVLCAKDERLEQLTHVFLIAAGATALVNLVLYFVSPTLLSGLGVEAFDVRKDRFDGLARNPNQLATIYVLAVPLALAAALKSRGLSRMISIAIAIASALVVVVAASRSATGGVAIGALVLFLAYRKGHPRQAIAALVGLGASAALALYGISQLEAARPLIERLSQGLSDQAVAGRDEAVLLTLELIALHPLGVGFGLLEESIRNFADSRITTPHNSIVAIGAMQGWLGLAGAVLLMLMSIALGWKAARAGAGQHRILAAAFLAGVIGFWIHATFHTVHHYGALWIYLGLAARAWARRQTQDSANPATA